MSPPIDSGEDRRIPTAKQHLQDPHLAWVDSISQLLDTQFRIPGTNTRFGADFLMGLVPGIGDATSLGFSGLLVATMARHGASPKLVVRMLLNLGLDALVGSIPVLGSVFDLYYKANMRNLKLMREYYEQDKHRGSVWPMVLLVIVVILLMLMALVVVGALIANWLWTRF